MKIAYICSDIDVEVFGFEGCSVHVREFCNGLAALGHDVIVFCAWSGDQEIKDLNAEVHCIRPNGLEIIAREAMAAEPIVANNHLERDLSSILWNTALRHRAREILANNPPDFIYERYALFGWGGAGLRDDLNIPLIMEINAPLTTQQAGYRKFTFTETAEVMESEIIRSADHLIVLTQWLQDWVVGLGAASERVSVIPSAVSNRLFCESNVGVEVRERYGLVGKRVVGFVGSFHAWHDLGGLLHAFTKFYRRNPDTRLLLVGGGATRRQIEKTARGLDVGDAVVFTGRIPHDEIPQIIAAMDITVAPYKKIDSFFFSPMKVFEYMALGRATIAADLGDIESIIENGVSGWTYRAGDNEDLVVKLEHALASNEERKRVGEEARKRVMQNHTWESVAGSVVQVAEKLIQRRRHGVGDTGPRLMGGR